MDRPSRTEDDRPAPLVRSEERLEVSTEAVPVRRAVLRVRTTTEQVMVPVTVTRQHAYLEHLDVDPGTAVPVPTAELLTGATGDWVVLTQDEPVVTTRPVPVERVRLVTEWVTGTQEVTATLAHEEVVQDLPRRP